MFSGILGPLILRVIKNQQIAQTRIAKGTMKQTAATIKSSQTFGLASKLGGKIRLSFKNYTMQNLDTDACGRITGQLVGILQQARDEETGRFSFDAQSFDSLSDFTFNTNSPLKKWLLINPKINLADGQLKINWPGAKSRLPVKFPAKAKACKITMAVTFFRLQAGYRLFEPLSQQIIIKADQQPLAAQEFVFTVPAGCLCIVSYFLSYLNSSASYGQVINSKMFNPAGIVTAVITPGTYVENAEFSWVSMNDLQFN